MLQAEIDLAASHSPTTFAWKPWATRNLANARKLLRG